MDAQTIIEGEAIEEMQRLPSRSIDLLLTDPPFNHETEHYDTRDRDFSRPFKSLADFALMNRFFAEFTEQAARVVKPEGRILVFCDCYSYPLFQFLLRGRFDHVRALIWYKGDTYFSLGANQAFRYSYEMIAHAFNTESWFDKKQRQDVIKMKNVPHGEREHPAQKPIELMKLLIEATCPIDGVVLDPFAGSGTVAIAAKALARGSISIEANPAFCQVIKTRIADNNSQLLLTTSEQAEPATGTGTQEAGA